MRKRKLSQADVQRAVGVRSGVVTRWVRGLRKPGIRLAFIIERTYGIAVQSWLEDAPELVPVKGTGTEGK
jgi:transcriptional regulator with XRE-family HTH domain